MVILLSLQKNVCLIWDMCWPWFDIYQLLQTMVGFDYRLFEYGNALIVPDCICKCYIWKEWRHLMHRKKQIVFMGRGMTTYVLVRTSYHCFASCVWIEQSVWIVITRRHFKLWKCELSRHFINKTEKWQIAWFVFFNSVTH